MRIAGLMRAAASAEQVDLEEPMFQSLRRGGGKKGRGACEEGRMWEKKEEGKMAGGQPVQQSNGAKRCSRFGAA